MPARSPPLDLDEIRRREDGPKQAEVEDVGAVVPGGHHAHRHANARLARLVTRDEVARTHQVVVGEVDGELLRAGDRGGNLHAKSDWYLPGT